MSQDLEKKPTGKVNYEVASVRSVSITEDIQPNTTTRLDDHHSIHRKLEKRHVNLIAIGGSIGTALFISIGTGGLVNAGPLGLVLAYGIWSVVILLLTVSVGEMVVYLPVASPFLNMAGRVVDPAFECAASVNFWIMQSLYIPFEITAANSMIHYWRDDYSPAITLCVQVVLYACLNIFAVRFYGEAEFWMSLGKVILIIGLFFFTLITMCGGNPDHDAFGFRNWGAAGGPIAELYTTGTTGRFHGFLAGIMSACFCIVGPEYLSMVASEAKNPRETMRGAFRTVLYRLIIFFFGGALCVSIMIAYNNPEYLALASESSNAAASPYVVAMNNMGIKVLPDIVAVLILTSIISAGNSYMFTSSRTLYALSIRGIAPKPLSICYNGVPVYCVGISVCFALLSLLQLGDSSTKVLNYLVNLCTGSQLMNYGFMSITYVCFYRAVKAQGIDRNQFHYRGWFQPWGAIISGSLIWMMVFVLGYRVFMPGHWAVDSFLFSYLMLFIAIAVFLSWKVFKKTKFIKPEDADLVTGLDEIEEHEYHYYAGLEANGKAKQKWYVRILDWVF